MYSHRHHLRGFTLIELLVVIVIIGLLTSVATTSYSRAQLNARDNARKTNISNLAQAVETYFSMNKTYPGKRNTDLDKEPSSGYYTNCEDKLAGSGPYFSYYYRYVPGLTETNNCSTVLPKNDPTGYTYKPTDYKSFPAWIPGLSRYINPFPVENTPMGVVLGATTSDPLTNPNVRTYFYRHLDGGYALYTRLESTSQSDDKNELPNSDVASHPLTQCSPGLGGASIQYKYSSPSDSTIYIVCK